MTTGTCEPFVCRDGLLLPRYNDAQTNLSPGLYLGLFHGRNAVDDILDDRGFGPVIGPLEFVHTTYAAEIKLRFVENHITPRYFPGTWFVADVATGELVPCAEAMLTLTDDLVVFGDRYFGDCTVFVQGMRA
ncbi:hypothetical protein BOC40_01505 [Burkholderia pseudomallei]|uniref:hypothetical protein n=1 Tax=Burkholderia pseudomallei TaxID=28450 RepID=UPI000A1A09D2|nr:hypothetical protein [Burkholderia pseudomallei]ARK79250.1 hypothetical protein BOC40_01505 [Burkholderia pseudomallei]ARL47174.1 hypothetical protein BOC50_30425 [Burkholderia pseudomallei]